MWTPSKQKTPMSVRLKNMSCSSGGWQGSESGERSWGVNTCGLILPSSKSGRILHVLCTLTHNVVWEDIFIFVSLLHKGEMRELGLQHENELTSIFASELTNCLGFDRTKPLPWALLDSFK